jgi:hypothetical protein
MTSVPHHGAGSSPQRRPELQVIALPIAILLVLFALSLVATLWPSAFVGA